MNETNKIKKMADEIFPINKSRVELEKEITRLQMARIEDNIEISRLREELKELRKKLNLLLTEAVDVNKMPDYIEKLIVLWNLCRQRMRYEIFM